MSFWFEQPSPAAPGRDTGDRVLPLDLHSLLMLSVSVFFTCPSCGSLKTLFLSLPDGYTLGTGLMRAFLLQGSSVLLTSSLITSPLPLPPPSSRCRFLSMSSLEALVRISLLRAQAVFQPSVVWAGASRLHKAAW